MNGWTRKTQEQEGSYYFNGKFLITKSVQLNLSEEEIQWIYKDMKQQVEEKDGIDYLLVYEKQDGGNTQKLFFIDQLNKEMIQSGEFKKEYNYCTLLFAHEY